MMKQNVSLEETQAFKVVLDRERYIKSSEVISAEQGAADMAALLGEDFLSVFETSPIPVSVEVSLRADYVSVDSLMMIQNHLMGMAQVDEVSYQTSLVDALNANMSRISAVLGVFIALLLFISFVLINNTVRLSVYDRRFTVHTMNLVGATRAFIRAPFLLQSLFQGVFAALFAVLMLLGMLFYVKSGMAQLFTVFRLELLLAVIGIVLASGIVICVGSTYFVVGRLISLKKDELY
jgi:cell division transport system permease protein